MQHKSAILFLLLITSFFYFKSFSQEAFSQGKVSPYTAFLLSSVEESQNDTALFRQTVNKFGIKKQGKTDYINAYIESNVSLNEITQILDKYKVKICSFIGNIITAEIPVNELDKLALEPSVERIEAGIPVYPLMDKAREATNADDVQSGTQLTMPYKGKDVIVGIIDGGFEYGHINFYNTDRSELRVKRVWDQNTSTEYKTEYEILTAETDKRLETHGTHVAGIAAGADESSDNAYYGVAPESDLVFVSFQSYQNLDNVGITNAIKYVYDYADEVGKPCVVNMSLGMHIGPHDGTSTFDELCDRLQGKGKLLVGAAGNEASRKVHVSKYFQSITDTLKAFISFDDRNQLSDYCDIWSEPDNPFTIRFVVYNTFSRKELYKSEPIVVKNRNNFGYELSQEKGHGAEGFIRMATEKNKKNNKYNAFIAINLGSIPINNALGIIITDTKGTVHAWANSSTSFSDKNMERWTDGDSEYSTGEIGGTGNRIISVGAYTSRTQYSGGSLNNITSYSSRGPTADGRVKPEIAAPGAAIISSLSASAVENVNEHNRRKVKTTSINGRNYYYGHMQGTSMAAPHVTGILATWLQAKSDLTPEEAKFFLQKTAIKDEFTGDIPFEGNNTWGYGKIDALAGMKEINKYKSMVENQQHIILYNYASERKLKIVFSQNDSDVRLLFSDTAGRVVMDKEIGEINLLESYNDFPVEIDLSALNTGLYFLKVTGKNHQYKAEKFIVR